MANQCARSTEGGFFTFEKRASKAGGGDGWADVWYRRHFGWEYKGKHKDLDAAYLQLLRFKDDLENPPLLIVWDFDRFVIHANFTNMVKRTYEFNLDGLADPANLRILWLAFTDPAALKPGTTPADDLRMAAIAAAAKRLDALRRIWLNPPDASDAELKKRTLTNLYNARPAWLANAHAALDRAVWNAYGREDADPTTVPDDEIFSRLLSLN